MLAPGLHHLLGVCSIGTARADGDALHRLRAGFHLLLPVIADEAGVPLHQVGIVDRAHRAAAGPAFIAKPEIAHLVRLRMTIGGTLLTRGAGGRRGHVGEPVRRFLDRARSQVHRHVGFAADLADEVHEFVGSEGVGLARAAPVGVDGGPACIGRTDPVAPVIFIREAAARPAHVGHFDGLERRDHVLADAAHIGNRRILADPHAAIDAETQMFRELAEDVAIDDRTRLARFDLHRDGIIFVRGMGDGRCRHQADRQGHSQSGPQHSSLPSSLAPPRGCIVNGDITPTIRWVKPDGGSAVAHPWIVIKPLREREFLS